MLNFRIQQALCIITYKLSILWLKSLIGLMCLAIPCISMVSVYYLQLQCVLSYTFLTPVSYGFPMCLDKVRYYINILLPTSILMDNTSMILFNFLNNYTWVFFVFLYFTLHINLHDCPVLYCAPLHSQNTSVLWL